MRNLRDYYYYKSFINVQTERVLIRRALSGSTPTEPRVQHVVELTMTLSVTQLRAAALAAAG